MNILPPIIEIGLAMLVVIAAAVDLKSRRIPNLVLPGIGAGFALNGFLSGLNGLARAGLASVLRSRQLCRPLLNVQCIFAALLNFRAPYREKPELDIAHSQAVTLPHGLSIAIGSLLVLALSHYARRPDSSTRVSHSRYNKDSGPGPHPCESQTPA